MSDLLSCRIFVLGFLGRSHVFEELDPWCYIYIKIRVMVLKSTEQPV